MKDENFVQRTSNKRNTVILIVALVVIAAIGSQMNKENQTESSVNVAATQTSSAPDSTDAGDLGEYHIAIKTARISSDYSGSPALIVSYDFTNNSSRTQMFAAAATKVAYQDGVKLDEVFVMKSDYDSGAAVKSIKKGATYEVYTAFRLKSTISPVEIELTKPFYPNGPKLTKTFDLADL